MLGDTACQQNYVYRSWTARTIVRAEQTGWSKCIEINGNTKVITLRRDRFVKILDQVRARHSFRVIGYVIMPEHVHLLLTEPEKGNPSKILQVLKQKVSAAMRTKARGKASPNQLTLQFPEVGTDEKHFWQRRFYDFSVWSEKKLWEKLNYMHRNPVERKLVRHPKEWPWSSWSHYEKREEGLLRIDPLK